MLYSVEIMVMTMNTAQVFFAQAGNHLDLEISQTGIPRKGWRGHQLVKATKPVGTK